MASSGVEWQAVAQTASDMVAANCLSIHKCLNEVIVERTGIKVQRCLFGGPLGCQPSNSCYSQQEALTIAHPASLLSLTTIGRNGVEITELCVHNCSLNPVQNIQALVLELNVASHLGVRMHKV